MFVSEFGGGIIFISGSMYNPRTLANTPLANLLPVVADENRDLYEHDKVYSQTFGYQLTPDGRTHPITNFKEFKGDKDKNQEHWEARANPKFGLPGHPLVHAGQEAEGGRVAARSRSSGSRASQPAAALRHPARRPRPRLLERDRRDLALALRRGDYPWFYRSGSRRCTGPARASCMGARRYRVSSTRNATRAASPSGLRERVRREVRAEDRPVDRGVRRSARRPRGPGAHQGDPPQGQDRDGYYEGPVPSGRHGLYRIWAGEEDEATRATAKFTVFIPDREDDEPILDVGTLKELAPESAGGKFFPWTRWGA
jgi:hypothetical protein